VIAEKIVLRGAQWSGGTHLLLGETLHLHLELPPGRNGSRCGGEWPETGNHRLGQGNRICLPYLVQKTAGLI